MCKVIERQTVMLLEADICDEGGSHDAYLTIGALNGPTGRPTKFATVADAMDYVVFLIATSRAKSQVKGGNA